jgi:general secretion pathway protein A
VQPLESLDALADPIYEAFYGLKEQPFAISTDPKFLFLSAPHRRAYDELRTGLLRDESLLLLTGETGSGKTTLCRGVIGSLGDRTFSSILHQPYMTGPEMLRLILRDFGLVSREELRRGVLAGADVPQLLDVLESFLRSLVSIDSRAIVVLDEAQSLSPTLLDEVRMLTAFERDGKRLVQIVMCGQPMLLNTLKTEPMYALNERITRRVALMPLSSDEVEAYINHRLAVAGGQEKVTFQPEAVRLIAELSRGLPRRVNVLCDRTLQEGRIQGAMSISAALVKRAAKALAGQHPAGGGAVLGTEADASSTDAPPIDILPEASSRRTWMIAAAVGGIVLAGVAAYHLYARSVLADVTVPPTPESPSASARQTRKTWPLPTDADVDAVLKLMLNRQ